MSYPTSCSSTIRILGPSTRRSRPAHGKKCDGTLAKTDRRARCGRSWQTNHLEFLRTFQGEQQLQKGTKRQESRKGEFVQRARRTGSAATVRTQSSSTFPARSRFALKVDENRTLYFALLPFIRRSFSLTRV